MYFVGQTLNCYLKADEQAESKWTPWNSISAYLSHNRAIVLFRLFLSTCALGLWFSHPSTLNFFGFDWEHMLPLNAATAGIYGGLSDRIMDYFLSKIGCRLERRRDHADAHEDHDEDKHSDDQ